MNGAEYLMVELIDGHAGEHGIIGLKTKTHYGYRSHGDQFLMHKNDVQIHSNPAQRMGRVRVVTADLNVTEPESTPEEEEKPVQEEITVEMIDGVPAISAITELSEKNIADLEKLGVQTVMDLIKMSDEDLLGIKGIGEVKANKIRKEAEQLING